MTATKKRQASPSSRPKRVGKLRGGKGGWEPRSRIVARVERVLMLHEQGWTQDEIARDVDVTQAAVSKILGRADLRALKALDHDVASLKMRRLRVLEYVSREGRRAWELSKKGRTRKRQRQATGASGESAVTHELVIDEHPDPRLLDQARKAEEAMADVCGFTGGSQGPGRGPIGPTPLPELTLAEIAARLNALLDEAMAPAGATPDVVPIRAHSEAGDE